MRGTHLAKELKMSDRHGGNFDEFPSTLQFRMFPAAPEFRNEHELANKWIQELEERKKIKSQWK